MSIGFINKSRCFTLLLMMGWGLSAEALPVHGSATNLPSGKQLQTVSDVRSLPREVADNDLPVLLRGVVTVMWPEGLGDGFIINDDTGALFVSYKRAQKLERGAFVEVKGKTGKGGYAPIVQADHVSTLGSGTLPLARPTSVAELLTGRYDCQRVELRGVIQSVSYVPEKKILNFDLATESGHVVLNVMPAGPDDGANLVNAEVLVRGVAAPIFNSRAELMGVWIRTGSFEDVRILTPAPLDPFDVPTIEIGRLMPYSPEGMTLHRRCTKGVVTLARPSGEFYIQMGGRGVAVTTRPDLLPKVGETVEVSGFIDTRGFFARLVNACVRSSTTRACASEAIRVTPAMILKYDTILTQGQPDYDGTLVRMKGKLQKIEGDASTGHQLYMDCEGYLVLVECGTGCGEALRHLRSGSDVDVTGVCVVGYSSLRPVLHASRALSFRLLLRSPADVAVLKQASWWTPRRLLILVAGLLVLLAGMVLWSVQLQRLVEMRSVQVANEMRERLAAESRVEERTRLAAELHDSMAQSLTGVALQLRSARKAQARDSESASRYWDMAEKMLEASREELHRCVWDLQDSLLEKGELADALRAAGEQLGAAADIHVSVDGMPQKLPEYVMHGLLRSAQEALANAVKHGEASRVKLLLNYGTESVRLVVEDDGKGFDPETVAGPGSGHFGLQSIRERVQRMKGQLEIKSQPGVGTQVSIRVPLNT